MTTLLRDARFGLRLLGKHPAFAAIAVVTLAVGISANTAIFSVIHATYLAPLPYRDAGRLVMVWSYIGSDRAPNTLASFDTWKRQATVFEDLNGWTWKSVNVLTDAGPEHFQAGPATAGFLSMLGYGHPLALGRTFLEEEGTPGKDNVVVLSHRLWRERFGRDERIIGRAIRIDGKPHTVVGVLGAGPPDHNQTQLWVPLAFGPEQLRQESYFLLVMGRLKPGATVEQATANVAALSREIARTHPAQTAPRPNVEPFRNNFVSSSTKAALWLLVGAVAFVLLIACANVANLLLARGSARQRELAVRLALGASRAGIIRQLITESLVLSVLGGALGIALAYGFVDVIMKLMPPFTLPTEVDVRLNVPVLLFTVGTCALAGVLFGCAPAWQAARTNVNDTLKEAGGRSAGGGRHRLRRALVTVEFALALTLLTAGGLAIHSFVKLATADVGFRTERLLTFSLPVQASELTGADRITAFYDELLQRIQVLPGVASASVSTGVLAGGNMPFAIAGRPPADPAARTDAVFNMVSPEYFATLGIPIRRGRGFTSQDRRGGVPVAVVNEAFVRRYLPDVDPLTQRLVVAEIRSTGDGVTLGAPIEWQIVGVQADVRNAGLRRESAPAISVPFSQSPWPRASIAVRTVQRPASLRQSLAAIVRSVDPNLPIANVKTMEEIVSEAVAGDRFNTVLFASFAGVALLLATIGIYGVMSFAVSQRTHEIGLRMALGAERSRVLRQVLRDGMSAALLGMVFGSVGAYFVTRAMRTVLYGVGDTAPAAFVLVALTLLAAALLACFVPARRAASVDPMTALRGE